MPAAFQRSTVAATVGTALEWYDFSLYATASALVFPHVFFPHTDGVLGILASFATFAVGFFARPVGGIVIGAFGDRVGRRQMLFLTLILMAGASTLIGLIPGYGTMGVWACVLLVGLRLVQGFGAGGEYAGATLLAAEHAGTGNRGLHASMPAVGNAAGALLATGVFALTQLLPEDDFLSWGWRIPFLLSVFVGLAGVLIRRNVTESAEFEQAVEEEQPSKLPLLEVVRVSGRRFPLAMVASIGPNVASYLPSVYALTYLADDVGTAAWVGTTAILISNACKFVTIPLMGALTDRVGRRPVFIAGGVGGALFAFPFFALLDTGTPVLVWLAFILLFAVCNDAMLASQAGFMSELFDARMRYSGVASSREIAGAVVGGTLPFAAAALSEAFGGASWPVTLYAIALLLAAAIAVAFLPETAPSRGGAAVGGRSGARTS